MNFIYKAIGVLTCLLAVNAYATDTRSYVLMPKDSDVSEFKVMDNDITFASQPNTYLNNRTSYVKHTHYMDISGNLAAIYIIAPYTDLKQETSATVKKGGLTDPILLFAWGMYNMPALTKEEYTKANKRNTTSACSVALTLPIGSYDSQQLMNVGGNRYVVKPECQVGTYVGNFYVEVIGGLTHYGNNSSYYGSNVLKQDKLYHLESHIGYGLTPKAFLSFDMFSVNGGNMYLNNKSLNKGQRSLSLGANLSYFVDNHTYFKFIYQDTVNASITSPKVKTLAMSYNYIW